MSARAPLPAVLVLAPHWPPEGGAAAARLHGLSRCLRDRGHAVHVVAPTPSYMLAVEASGVPSDLDITRVGVAPRGSGRVANAWHQVRLGSALRGGARLALRRFPADVALVSSPPPLAALSGHGLGRDGRRLPVVLDVRDLWPDVWIESGVVAAASVEARVLRCVERRLLRRAAAVVTVTATKVARLSERAGGVPVALVPNGVDESWLVGTSYGGGGEAPAPFVALYAGNVGLAQDVGCLVAAVAHLPSRREGRRPVRAVIVGEGEDLPRVRDLAARLSAPVDFLPVEPRAAVRERLAGCGCAVVTLRSRTLVDAVPSKLLECLAIGVPVALVAAGEAARVLGDAGGGLACEPGDPFLLAEVLGRLADMTPAERATMGERGRVHVRARFTRFEAARALSEVLVSVTGGPRPAG
jgi:glycosyltransferase involved in cell wall biosynthesis